VKAERIRAFLRYLLSEYNGDFRRMSSVNWRRLREELLSVKGIGPETADSILLYACGKPVFVVDAYTRRVLSRHAISDVSAGYDDIQNIFMSNLPKKRLLFNEYHALLVTLCKKYCRKSANCLSCPARGL